MRKILNLLKLLLILPVVSGIMASCAQDEPDEISAEKERLILIYAVAANSLERNLTLDLNEILKVAPRLNLDNNILLVYSVDYSNECKLRKLVKNSKTGKFEFALEKTFPELPLSTSKERINEVLNYVNDHYDYERKGLILWSHGTGWIPSATGSTPATEKRRTFGEDKYEGVSYQTNINELAEAIPEYVFDFIWFDCCYMANIETVFELRNKTPYIIGSVEEIPSDGMPYDRTMPYLLQKDADLKMAATLFFDYYDDEKVTAPISIIATDDLPKLAETAKKIFATGVAPTNLSNIQNYTRGTMYSKGYRFYDMNQLLKSYTVTDESLEDELEEIMKKVVIFRLSNSYTTPGPAITNPTNYSGLSMHFYRDNDSYDETFYRELDWYKATR